MLSAILLATTLALAVKADVIPTEPAPGSDFRPGGPCSAKWNPDTTGTWTHTSIQLMTGSNEVMVHLTTLTTFDGTDSSITSYNFTCPDVDPHSPIYFLQFTSDATLTDPTQIQWTGRWSISNGDDLTPGPNRIPETPTTPESTWGIGRLVGTPGTPPPPTSPQYQAGGGSGTGTATQPSATGAPTNPSSTVSRTTPGGSQTRPGSTTTSAPTGTPTGEPDAALSLRGSSALGLLAAGFFGFAML